MSIWLWIPVAWILVAIPLNVTSVGRSRGPLDGRTVAVIVLVQMALVLCILKGGGIL